MKEIVVNNYKLEILPVSPLAPKAIEIQFKKKNPEPEQPTYEVEAAGGVVEKFLLTPETASTTEERQAYLEWKDAHEAWQAQLTYKLMRFYLSQGVKLKLTAKQRDNLEKQATALELGVPDNSDERDFFFLETFIISSAEVMGSVIKEIFGTLGIKEEAIEAANALFPD